MAKRDVTFQVCVPLAVILLAIGWPIPALRAQGTGLVRGVVIEMETGQSLPGVTVSLVGGSLKGGTDGSGTFQLTGVPEGRVQIRLALPGYASLVEEVEVHPGKTSILYSEMVPIVTVLDEILVAVPRNPTETSIQDTGQVVDRPPPSKVTEFLDRVAGAGVQERGGEVGSTPRVLIRGVSTLFQTSEPFVFLDGIRVSDPNTRPGSSWMFLDQLDPNTVDRVEVLKGPSASVIYGPATNSGVILIHTKRREQAPLG